MLLAAMNAESDNDQRANTVRKTVREPMGSKPTGSPNRVPMSATMRIPIEDIFDDVSVRRVSGLEIRIPDCPEPISHPLVNCEVTIGRHAEADIVIPLNSISREHARIFPHEEEFIIEDLNSTNGTYVNGVRISRCILRHNDLIRIGDATVLFSQQKTVG
jgi:pSer/pThr/pTyr-binding forkhead associated (FHA) protein